MNKIAAIPTQYAGVNFRSRLEARWAAVFDLLGWKWEYEPIDLYGYIPDFMLGNLLVEIKPHIGTDWYIDAVTKIRQSGWTGIAIVLGSDLVSDIDPDEVVAGVQCNLEYNDAELGLTICKSCNSPAFVLSGYLVPQTSLAFRCHRCNGDLGLGYGRDSAKRSKSGDELITRLWRQAGNKTQWKPVRGGR